MQKILIKKISGKKTNINGKIKTKVQNSPIKLLIIQAK